MLIYTIYTLFKAPASQEIIQEDKNIFLLALIGFCVGIFAMSIGIGGSLMLLPILVQFLKYDLKVATALGYFLLFFHLLVDLYLLHCMGICYIMRELLLVLVL